MAQSLYPTQTAPVAGQGGILGASGILSGTATGQLKGILSQGKELLNPWGSPRMMALLRRRALRIAQAQRGRGSRLSELYGVDPYAARGNAVNADVEASGGVANALNEAEYSDAAANRDYLRSLYGGQLDFERQRQLAKIQAKAQSQGGIGQAVGALGGALIGKI